MRNPERKPTIWPSFLLTLAIGTGAISLVAACGDDGGAEQPEEPPTEQIEQEGGLFDVTVEFQGGLMETTFEGGDADPAHMLSYCQGNELVEYLDNYFGGSSDRTIDHPACDDGILTADDFPTPEELDATTTTLG